jgi:CheY-like chemotaxis protein
VAQPDQTVLIVEDNIELRDLIVEFLRDEFRTIVATTADEGLALAQSVRPALILCDLNLPGKNGLHTIEAVRRNPELAHTRIIIMSGQEPPRTAPAFSKRFLAKPFTVQALMDAVLAELTTTTA